MRILLPLLFLGFNLSAQTAGSGVTDIDGNNYPTVIIGTQEWMKENLRVTKYSNGDAIPNITDNTQWGNLTSGAWSHYNNDSQYENPYGKLYNWYTVVDPRNVCPTGWHVPTDAEYTLLIDYLGGGPVAGGKMKSTGTQYWLSPNTAATNESGFSGLPGGYRYVNGPFNYIHYHGYWWSSTEYSTYDAWNINPRYDSGAANRSLSPKGQGESVRCLKGSAPLGVIELNSEPKKLLKITDLMGREVEETPNTVLIYMYTDGTAERKYIVE